jgi:hypothetical protein
MKRATFRLNQAVHIVAGVYNLAFVYTPLHQWRYGLGVVQWITMPLLIVTGYMLLRIPKHGHSHNHTSNGGHCDPTQLNSRVETLDSRHTVQRLHPHNPKGEKS